MAKDSIVMVRMESAALEVMREAAAPTPVSTWLRDLALSAVGLGMSKDWESAAKLEFGLAAVTAVRDGYGSSWARMDAKERYEAVKAETERASTNDW